MNSVRTTILTNELARCQESGAHQHRIIALAFFIVLASSMITVRAGNPYVPNGSFESPATPFVGTAIDSWQKTPQPPTYDTNLFGDWDTLVGLFANSPPTNADYIDNADGSQLAYIFAYPQTGLFQDYNSTDWSNSVPTHAFNSRFEVGKAYTLTAAVTSSSERPLSPGATLLISLYYRDAASNMVTVAATTVTYSTNVFTNLTHLLDFQVKVPAVKAADAWAGQNIGIQILSTLDPTLINGGVWDLDNLRLVDTVAPVLQGPSFNSGQFQFTLLSEPGAILEVLATTNLTQSTSNWTSLGTVTNVTGKDPFTDTSASSAARFYTTRRSP